MTPVFAARPLSFFEQASSFSTAKSLGDKGEQEKFDIEHIQKKMNHALVYLSAIEGYSDENFDRMLLMNPYLAKGYRLTDLVRDNGVLKAKEIAELIWNYLPKGKKTQFVSVYPDVLEQKRKKLTPLGVGVYEEKGLVRDIQVQKGSFSYGLVKTFVFAEMSPGEYFLISKVVPSKNGLNVRFSKHDPQIFNHSPQDVSIKQLSNQLGTQDTTVYEVGYQASLRREGSLAYEFATVAFLNEEESRKYWHSLREEHVPFYLAEKREEIESYMPEHIHERTGYFEVDYLKEETARKISYAIFSPWEEILTFFEDLTLEEQKRFEDPFSSEIFQTISELVKITGASLGEKNIDVVRLLKEQVVSDMQGFYENPEAVKAGFEMEYNPKTTLEGHIWPGPDGSLWLHLHMIKEGKGENGLFFRIEETDTGIELTEPLGETKALMEIHGAIVSLTEVLPQNIVDWIIHLAQDAIEPEKEQIKKILEARKNNTRWYLNSEKLAEGISGNVKGLWTKVRKDEERVTIKYFGENISKGEEGLFRWRISPESNPKTSELVEYLEGRVRNLSGRIRKEENFNLSLIQGQEGSGPLVLGAQGEHWVHFQLKQEGRDSGVANILFRFIRESNGFTLAQTMIKRLDDAEGIYSAYIPAEEILNSLALKWLKTNAEKVVRDRYGALESDSEWLKMALYDPYGQPALYESLNSEARGSYEVWRSSFLVEDYKRGILFPDGDTNKYRLRFKILFDVTKNSKPSSAASLGMLQEDVSVAMRKDALLKKLFDELIQPDSLGIDLMKEFYEKNRDDYRQAFLALTKYKDALKDLIQFLGVENIRNLLRKNMSSASWRSILHSAKSEKMIETLSRISEKTVFGNGAVQEAFSIHGDILLKEVLTSTFDLEAAMRGFNYLANTKERHNALRRAFKIDPMNLLMALMLLGNSKGDLGVLDPYIQVDGSVDIASLMSNKKITLKFIAYRARMAFFHASKAVVDLLNLSPEQVSFTVDERADIEEMPFLSIEDDAGSSKAEVSLAFNSNISLSRDQLLPLMPYKYLSPKKEGVSKNISSLNSARKVIIAYSPSEKEAGLIVKAYNEAYREVDKEKRPILILGLLHREGELMRSPILHSLRVKKRTLLDQRRNESWEADKVPFRDLDIVILRTQGELVKLSQIADLALVGQDRNIVEPANQHVPILYFESKHDWYYNLSAKDLLVKTQAAQAIEEGSLAQQMVSVLNDEKGIYKQMTQGAEAAVAFMNEAIAPTAKIYTSIAIAAEILNQVPGVVARSLGKEEESHVTPSGFPKRTIGTEADQRRIQRARIREATKRRKAMMPQPPLIQQVVSELRIQDIRAVGRQFGAFNMMGTNVDTKIKIDAVRQSRVSKKYKITVMYPSAKKPKEVLLALINDRTLPSEIREAFEALAKEKSVKIHRIPIKVVKLEKEKPPKQTRPTSLSMEDIKTTGESFDVFRIMPGVRPGVQIYSVGGGKGRNLEIIYNFSSSAEDILKAILENNRISDEIKAPFVELAKEKAPQLLDFSQGNSLGIKKTILGEKVNHLKQKVANTLNALKRQNWSYVEMSFEYRLAALDMVVSHPEQHIVKSNNPNEILIHLHLDRHPIYGKEDVGLLFRVRLSGEEVEIIQVMAEQDDSQKERIDGFIPLEILVSERLISQEIIENLKDRALRVIQDNSSLIQEAILEGTVLGQPLHWLLVQGATPSLAGLHNLARTTRHTLFGEQPIGENWKIAEGNSLGLKEQLDTLTSQHTVLIDAHDFRLLTEKQREEMFLYALLDKVKVFVYNDTNSDLAPLFRKTKNIEAYSGDEEKVYNRVQRTVEGKMIHLSKRIDPREQLSESKFNFVRYNGDEVGTVGMALLYQDSDGRTNGFVRDEEGFLVLNLRSQLLEMVLSYQAQYLVAIAA